MTLLFAGGMQDVEEGLSKNETAPKREAEKSEKMSREQESGVGTEIAL